MTTTVQTIVDQARKRLGDDAKAEMSDARLLTYYNEAQQELIAVRPDWVVGSFASLPTDKALVDNIPFPDIAAPSLIDSVVGKANGEDSEATSDNRMSYFQQSGASKR